MKNIISFFVGLCCWFLNISQVFSQSVTKDTLAPSIINATGGNKVYDKISYEWSIGEAIVTEAMISGNIVITNGILQPAGERTATRYLRPDNTWSDDEIRIYPNPSKDWLTINFFSIETGLVTLRFYDAQGRLVYFKQFHYSGGRHLEMMNVSSYASGNYFLNIDLAISYSTQSIQKNRNYHIQILR